MNFHSTIAEYLDLFVVVYAWSHFSGSREVSPSLCTSEVFGDHGLFLYALDGSWAVILMCVLESLRNSDSSIAALDGSLVLCVYDGFKYPWPASAGALGPFAIRHQLYVFWIELEAMATF